MTSIGFPFKLNMICPRLPNAVQIEHVRAFLTLGRSQSPVHVKHDVGVVLVSTLSDVAWPVLLMVPGRIVAVAKSRFLSFACPLALLCGSRSLRTPLVVLCIYMCDAFTCGSASVGQHLGGNCIAGAAVVSLHATNQSKSLGLLTCQRLILLCRFVQQAFIPLFQSVSRLLLLMTVGECIARTIVSTSSENIDVDGRGGGHLSYHCFNMP